jgi:hypothetical protein
MWLAFACIVCLLLVWHNSKKEALVFVEKGIVFFNFSRLILFVYRVPFFFVRCVLLVLFVACHLLISLVCWLRSAVPSIRLSHLSVTIPSIGRAIPLSHPSVTVPSVICSLRPHLSHPSVAQLSHPSAACLVRWLLVPYVGHLFRLSLVPSVACSVHQLSAAGSLVPFVCLA